MYSLLRSIQRNRVTRLLNSCYIKRNTTSS
nr:MAG TPA: hypothetical protein [Bacteriophage sp.]